MISADLLAYASRIVSATGTVLVSCEAIAVADQYDGSGIFSSNIFVTRSSLTEFASSYTFFRQVCSSRGVIALNLVRAFVAASLFIPSLPSDYYAMACLSVLIINCAMSYRMTVGGDGSDQMLNVVMAGLCIWYLFPNEATGWLGLGFIAAQAILAYVAAGVSKLNSATWRRGDALRLIFQTKCYGSQTVSAALRKYPVLNILGCWATICFETSLPFAVVAPLPILVFALLGGVIFHASCALIMGLNCFFWQFTSTYPILFLLAELIQVRISHVSALAVG